MGCGCGGATWTPPAAAAQAAVNAQDETIAGPIGPNAPGYTWNGPQPQAKAKAVKARG